VGEVVDGLRGKKEGHQAKKEENLLLQPICNFLSVDNAAQETEKRRGVLEKTRGKSSTITPTDYLTSQE